LTGIINDLMHRQDPVRVTLVPTQCVGTRAYCIRRWLCVARQERTTSVRTFYPICQGTAEFTMPALGNYKAQ